MTVLNPTVPWGPHILSSKHHTLFTSTFLTYPKHLFFFKTKPNSFLPFSSFLPLPHTIKIQTFARFSRPTNRRNSLRKKLAPPPPPQLNEVTSNPPGDYDNIDANYSIFDKDGVEKSKVDDTDVRGSVDVGKIESLGDSELRKQLERWADQYKADSEFWGLGFNPIFNVFKNKEGKIERVVVNEEEILERNGVDPAAYKRSRSDVDFVEVSSKISHAKFLAREMEIGIYEVPKSSSLAKFVTLGNNPGFVESIRGFSIPSNFPMKKISNFGVIVFCGFFVISAIRALFDGGEDKEEYTRLEKEMLRRKIKAREGKEKLVKGNVEVIDDPLETILDSAERPRLDKEELLNSITKAKPNADRPVGQESFSNESANSNNLDAKVMEIRAMARRVRETRRGNSSSGDGDEMDEFNFDGNDVEVVEEEGERVKDLTNGLSDSHSAQRKDYREISIPFFSNDWENDSVLSDEEAMVDNSDTQEPNSSKTKALGRDENIVKNVIGFEVASEQDHVKNIHTESIANISAIPEVKDSFDTLNGQAVKAKKAFGKKPWVITSVKEAKEFLAQKNDKQEPLEEYRGNNIPEGDVAVSNKAENETSINTKQSSEKGNGVIDRTISGESKIGSETNPLTNNEKWMENNFQTLEPVFKKIGGGFRENYAVAREKIKQELDITPSMDFPEFDNDDDGLDWMKDDKLREIVFQVRDNELTGHDPFHLMDEDDKLAFFEGLEKKVEKENEKLSKLHEYLHSNIENLDYGADGMSVYDTPEKIIPRWKGPPINQSQNQNPEFLENFAAQRRTLVNGTKNQNIKRENGVNSLDEIRESPLDEKILAKSDLNDQNKKNPKTVIEGSDGSFRAGKKSGKEFWEHTKKWSQGFLDSYNAETDPEMKAVMKDMGKDLDRWITPSEIQEAADLMDELPQKKKDFIEKKLNKVRREMELFGPQAVLSKYKEYGDQKEEDYLWWLDLPFVLCIELYTNNNGDQRIGLYSLEMAEDLELDPKPIHVIAFEDPGDCKNLCYIIQAHMEMLGNGNAFVVARPPKDAFREAKANGFSVTVIRKGELRLNVDQMLEEVEEQITEIGTKIYHDKTMGGQSVDMSALMKGVFGAGKPSKRRRARPKLKRPTNWNEIV